MRPLTGVNYNQVIKKVIVPVYSKESIAYRLVSTLDNNRDPREQ